MGELSEADETVKWYAMRDLKRHNAKEPAYRLFEGNGIEVLTLMKWLLVTKKGKRIRVEVPFIPDLLFVRDCKQNLDSIVKSMETLQYRYVNTRKMLFILWRMNWGYRTSRYHHFI